MLTIRPGSKVFHMQNTIIISSIISAYPLCSVVADICHADSVSEQRGPRSGGQRLQGIIKIKPSLSNIINKRCFLAELKKKF